MSLFEKWIAIDTHTHTLHSGHAWSTLSENAAAAAALQLSGICLTEHGPDTPGGPVELIPATQYILPRYIHGVRVYSGIEANILDAAGRLDLSERTLRKLDMAIASLHSMCFDCSNPDVNTQAYLNALKGPAVDILGHIHQSSVPCYLETVIRAAGEAGRVIELNAAYLIPERIADRPLLRETIRLCKYYGQEVAVGSDAHFCNKVGDVGELLKLMDDLEFPEELVVNLTTERFEAMLIRRKARLNESV